MTNPLLVEQDGGVLTLTNNDAPPQPLDVRVHGRRRGGRAWRGNPSVRALVFTAAGDE